MINQDYNEFMRIIRGSKEYRFDGTVLTVINYYTGKKIMLDLAAVTPEMLEELTPCYDDEDESEVW